MLKHHKLLAVKYLKESMNHDPGNRDCETYLSLVQLSLGKPNLAILSENPQMTTIERAILAIVNLS
jgi:hypothetical protein